MAEQDILQMYVEKDKDKDKSKSNKKEGCTRCGRGGHLVVGCYATCRKDGTVLEKPQSREHKHKDRHQTKTTTKN